MKKLLFVFLSLTAFSAIADTNVTPGSNSSGSFYNFNVNGETISVSASTSSSNAAFSLTNSINAPDVTVTNAGTGTAFVTCGIGSSTAAQLPGAGRINSFPILPSMSRTLRKGVGSDTCAAITSTGSATVYFTAGSGQ